ncbi:MAG: hypothetical protein JW995_04225 [Melioribacteraceae bacterium]|nr:hypothetical protein [Melioribacteraceae bacterium]
MFILFAGKLSAQTCGFGCLGLSGFYGGYSVYSYKPDGVNARLNEILQQLNHTSSKIKFDQTEGFRIGANIFRAQFDHYFLTAKGYYQFYKEKQSLPKRGANGNSLLRSTLELNHWGIGIDLGIPVFSFLDWKIVEGGITFYTADLQNEFNFEPDLKETQKYSYTDVNVGYYLGTGIIIELIPDYISIEGSAFYNMVSIKDLVDDRSNFFLGENSDLKILDKASISGTVQLNIGVPL